jgi:gluconolactonase
MARAGAQGEVASAFDASLVPGREPAMRFLDKRARTCPMVGQLRKGLWIIVLILVETACGRETQSLGLGTVVHHDSELKTVVPVDARLERLAFGLGLLEGPVWSARGYLLFSDMRSHVIHQWSPHDGLSVLRAHAVYIKRDHDSRRPSGPNGLAFDKEGRLTICEHGNRRVSRLEHDGTITVLAEHYEGRRLNSPNDLVYRSDGLMYFTDPPFGLPGGESDPQRDLPYAGVFLISESKLRLVSDELSGPNGLALSPDEKYLYVASFGRAGGVVVRYGVNGDGTLSTGEMFFDAAAVVRGARLDGMKVDVRGNLYVVSSGGILIISSTGKHLGTIQRRGETTNVAWGDDDGKGLYITGQSELHRVRLNVPGHRTFSRP